MVEEKIKNLFYTNTILHIDNPNHYDIIMPLTTFEINYRTEVNNGDFCINFDDKYNAWSNLKYFKKFNKYNSYKFITSTELIGNKIIEIWD
jgi:hypothetical protein